MVLSFDLVLRLLFFRVFLFSCVVSTERNDSTLQNMVLVSLLSFGTFIFENTQTNLVQRDHL